MGVFELSLQARLDNVEKVCFTDSFRWCLKIACSNCREEYSKNIYFESGDQVDSQGTRGTFNYVSKCKFCGSSGTLNLIGSKKEYIESEDLKPIARVEGRGIKVLKGLIDSGFNVISLSGKVFEEVKPEDNDWVEYDDRGEYLVGVYEISTNISEV